MNHSIQARFLVSLLANISRAFASFITGLFVAKGLGPENYGNLMYLLAAFAAMIQVLDSGSSSAFYTFVSERERSRLFIRTYFVWLGFMFFVPCIVIGLMIPTAWVELIWQEKDRGLVILAFVATFMQSVLWSTVMRMGEALRFTILVQGWAFVIAIIHLSIILLGWFAGWLDARFILTVISVEWGLVSIFMLRYFPPSEQSGEPETITKIVGKFWYYCFPLIPHAWLGFAHMFADRWLLQVFGGSIEQAYYAVAFQFSVLASLATSSILNIFWKEVAEANYQKNIERVKYIYWNVSRGLFFVPTAVACFLVFWAEDLLRVILGSAYVGGSMAFSVMLFFPIHQALGQLTGSFALATERVKVFTIVGMVFMVLSIIFAYLILAPKTAPFPGLEMGSLGLAFKMVLLQIIQTNILIFYISRSVGMKFDWHFQIAMVMVCGTFGFFSHGVSTMFFDPKEEFWYAIFLSGSVYFLVVGLLLFLFPKFVGLSAGSITELKGQVVWLVKVFVKKAIRLS